MKPLFGMIAGAVLLLSSCATSNEVNGGGIFQKRKYNKGFYWNKSSASTSLNSKNEESKVTEANELSEMASYSEFQNDVVEVVPMSESKTSNIQLSVNQFPGKQLKSQFVNSLSDSREFVRNINPIKKMSQLETKMIQKTVAKAKAPGREGDLGYILGIVLIVLLIIIIFSLLRELLYDIFPFLGPLLALILLIVLVVLLLRWLGIM